MLAYFLKINVAIALFYAFYRLFFYKDTFFTWRRVALLCFFAVSAVYPLLNIQTWITAQEPMVAMADLYADIVLPEFTLTPEKTTFDWKAILLQTAGFVYWGGVALLAARFLIQLAGIIRLAFRSRKTKIGNTNVHLLKQASGPFSFFHWIFIHPTSHTEDELSEILTHEQTHANQWHSIDVLVSEIVCTFCWFNPFAWLMKREIRTNLEYLADNRVLETGHDSKAYQYHLLGLSHHKAAATIYNSFNVLPLKKRIKMMNKKRTREIGRTKYLMFLPLAALLMIISNIEAVARTTKEVARDVIEAVEDNLTSDTTAPDMEVATETAPLETPAPQQDKDKLVTYKGVVVDKDGKAVEGAEFFVDGDYKLPQGQSYVTGKNGNFSFKAFENAKMIVIWKKDGKMMGVPATVNKENNSNMKIVMDREWQNPPVDDPDYPVYDSPNQQGTSFPCFFLFFMPSTIEEHVGNHYFRDLGVDLVFVQQRNLVNGNRKIHEIAEFLDRNLDPFPYTDGSGKSVPVPVQDQQWSIEDEELHYQFHIRTRILVEETENMMQEMEENNVGIKEND